MSAFFEEFSRVGIYKRSQGRIVRQVTFAALALTVLIGAWKLLRELKGYEASWPAWACYALPAAGAAVGIWAAYRAVNLPAFADFLIAVEAEMNKVSWPSWGELVRWSVVVIVVIFAIGILLFGFDAFWLWLFKLLGVYGSHPSA